MTKYPKKALRKTPILPISVMVCVVFGFFLLMTLTAESQGLYKEKPRFTQELFQRGEVLYQKQCSVCHGPHGRGDGQAEYLLYPKPRDFAGDKFRLISTTSQQATDEDLFKVIERGMAGSSMPPWKHLSETDRWALVYYVRYLSEVDDYIQAGDITVDMVEKGLPWEWLDKIVNKNIDLNQTITIPEEPKTTREGLNRGRELFVASCAGCHGAEGRGDGQQNMVDGKGLPTRPRDLTAGVFKADSSSEELYFRMVAGIPGSPMPSYTGVFTQEQIWDLIHFVQSLVPPGKEEKAPLKHTQITAHKVPGEIDTNPVADRWAGIKPIYVALTPLWWRDGRIEGVDVRAVYNEDKIAVLLSWDDPQKDDNIVEAQSFTDGAALQFSADEDPPFFGMGSAGHPVSIWHWKAAWEQEKDRRQDVETHYSNMATDSFDTQVNYEHGSQFDISKSETRFHDPKYITGWGAGNPLSDPNREKETAEEATAEGLGYYTSQRPKIENVKARGVWADGKWHVVFVRPLNPSGKDSLQFKPGESASIAFAIWDGAGGDRNGQKMVSIWNQFILENGAGMISKGEGQ